MSFEKWLETYVIAEISLTEREKHLMKAAYESGAVIERNEVLAATYGVPAVEIRKLIVQRYFD